MAVFQITKKKFFEDLNLQSKTFFDPHCTCENSVYDQHAVGFFIVAHYEYRDIHPTFHTPDSMIYIFYTYRLLRNHGIVVRQKNLFEIFPQSSCTLSIEKVTLTLHLKYLQKISSLHQMHLCQLISSKHMDHLKVQYRKVASKRPISRIENEMLKDY